jgi:penicillin-binding protein 2
VDTYLDAASSDWYKQRLAIMLFCIAVAIIILFFRLLYLQVIEGEEYKRLSENNCIRIQSTPPPRGLIFDRNGELLVDNRPSFDLYITVKDAKPLARTLENLVRFLNVPMSELKAKIVNSGTRVYYKPILLKKDIGRDVLALVEAHKFDLPGVLVKVDPRRHYIYKQSAAHLIGYLGEINREELKLSYYKDIRPGELIGKFGIEKKYEVHLIGKRGGCQVEVNSMGQVVRLLKTVDAIPGHNLLLTIDHKLQKKAEELLANVSGAVVAMEPATGQILAMASSPSFDQNAFVNGMSYKEWDILKSNPFRPMENKVIQAEYPPASPYKIITAIAALEEGIIDQTNSLFCPGHYRFGNRNYRCWKRTGHGKVNVVSALEESCDVFFYYVSQRLGIDRISRYARACGLGTATGIALAHEAKGLVPTAEWKKRRHGIRWQKGETLSVGIGQGYNLVTPLQMVVFISAIANKGKRVVPLVVSHIETAQGNIVRKSAVKMNGSLPASPGTLAIIRKSLWKVVNSRRGTARNVRIKGIEFTGKTGTAQVFSHKGTNSDRKKTIEYHLKSHAWFVGYAPFHNPKIAVAVIVEHGGDDTNMASPIASKLAELYLKSDSHF